MRTVIPAAVAAAALSLTAVPGALAQDNLQEQIRAYYTIDIQDPSGGPKWHTVRRGRLSWLKQETCEKDSQLFAGVHLATVRGFDLLTPAGKPPLVMLRAIDCKKD